MIKALPVELCTLQVMNDLATVWRGNYQTQEHPKTEHGQVLYDYIQEHLGPASPTVAYPLRSTAWGEVGHDFESGWWILLDAAQIISTYNTMYRDSEVFTQVLKYLKDPESKKHLSFSRSMGMRSLMDRLADCAIYAKSGMIETAANTARNIGHVVGANDGHGIPPGVRHHMYYRLQGHLPSPADMVTYLYESP